MNDQDLLDAYLQICLELYYDLLREDRWPWEVSTYDEDLLESDDI
ncbi:MAG: hypothetical protein AAFQ15_07130 [Pseudomonadota bacterium]